MPWLSPIPLATPGTNFLGPPAVCTPRQTSRPSARSRNASNQPIGPERRTGVLFHPCFVYQIPSTLLEILWTASLAGGLRAPPVVFTSQPSLRVSLWDLPSIPRLLLSCLM